MKSSKMPLPERFKLWFLRRFYAFRDMERDNAALQAKIASDSNLVESLNRYIAALETKIDYQSELLHDLKKQLEALTGKNKNAHGGMPRALHMEASDELTSTKK